MLHLQLIVLPTQSNSSRSAWVRAPGGPAPASISACRIHPLRAVSARSRYLAVCTMLRPPTRTSLTASALNSGVNCRLFLFVKSTSRRIIALSEVSTKAGELHASVWATSATASVSNVKAGLLIVRLGFQLHRRFGVGEGLLHFCQFCHSISINRLGAIDPERVIQMVGTRIVGVGMQQNRQAQAV